MTEEFDVIHAFQQIRQRLHDTRQPRNLGLIAEALRPTTFQLNNDGMTVPPLPLILNGADISRVEYSPANGQWITHDEVYETLDELEEEGEEDTIDIMDTMAWAYMPEGIKDDLCYKFYHGIRGEYTVLLTISNDNERPSLTAVQAKICKDAVSVYLMLNDDVIAWHTHTDGPVTDKQEPILFDYSYEVSGRFLLRAAQLLWSALGHQVCIIDSSYIADSDETTINMSDDELRNHRYSKVVQFGQLSGDFGLFKKEIRNARRRRNLY